MSLITVKHFNENTSGRDFVVGDIHGCYSAFQALLHHVEFHPGRDRVFCVGDLIDRGPQNMEALKLLKTSWFFSCLGNHEQMLIDHLRRPDQFKAYDSSWLSKNIRSFTERQYFAGQWLPMLERLPLVISVGLGDNRFYVVHAELLDDKKSVTARTIDQWSFMDPEKAIQRALQGRSLLKAYETGRPVARAHDKNLPMIYCGHTIVEQPMVLARQTFLDGGAYTIFKDRQNDDIDETKWLELENPALRMMDVHNGVCYSADPRTADVREVHVLRPITL